MPTAENHNGQRFHVSAEEAKGAQYFPSWEAAKADTVKNQRAHSPAAKAADARIAAAQARIRSANTTPTNTQQRINSDTTRKRQTL